MKYGMNILSLKNLSVFILLIFVFLSPSIDHSISTYISLKQLSYLFCDQYGICRPVDNSVPFITAFVVLSCVAILIIVSSFHKHLKWDPFHLRRFAIITLLSLFLGPGFIINGCFKTFWGRPRPSEVIENLSVYSPVWRINQNGHSNSSFPSGHASIGFFLGVPLIIFNRKKTGLLVGSVFGGLIGSIRIIQQAHYTSDVVFAGIFVFLSASWMIKVYDLLSRHRV